jgi:glutamine synthetase
MLMAGLDGIRNKLDPGPAIDKDLYDLPPEEAGQVKQVPGSLEEVLNALEADHQWLLEGGVFTQDVIDTWIEFKRKQVDEIRLRPHPWEFYLTFDT